MVKRVFQALCKIPLCFIFFKIFLSSWEIDEWWEISGRRIVFSFVWFRKEIRDKLIIEGVQVVSTLTQKCGKKNTSKLPKLHFLFLDIQPPITFFFLNQPFIPSLSLSLSLHFEMGFVSTSCLIGCFLSLSFLRKYLLRQAHKTYVLLTCEFHLCGTYMSVKHESHESVSYKIFSSLYFLCPWGGIFIVWHFTS